MEPEDSQQYFQESSTGLIMSQMNLVHIVTFCLSVIHFNVWAYVSSESGFSVKMYAFFVSSKYAECSQHIILDFIFW
jgi:hypothetical protein